MTDVDRGAAGTHTKNPAVAGGVFCSATKVGGVLLGDVLWSALHSHEALRCGADQSTSPNISAIY